MDEHSLRFVSDNRLNTTLALVYFVNLPVPLLFMYVPVDVLFLTHVMHEWHRLRARCALRSRPKASTLGTSLCQVCISTYCHLCSPRACAAAPGQRNGKSSERSERGTRSTHWPWTVTSTAPSPPWQAGKLFSTCGSLFFLTHSRSIPIERGQSSRSTSSS